MGACTSLHTVQALEVLPDSPNLSSHVVYFLQERVGMFLRAQLYLSYTIRGHLRAPLHHLHFANRLWRLKVTASICPLPSYETLILNRIWIFSERQRRTINSSAWTENICFSSWEQTSVINLVLTLLALTAGAKEWWDCLRRRWNGMRWNIMMLHLTFKVAFVLSHLLISAPNDCWFDHNCPN